jgi:hypothetical protein
MDIFLTIAGLIAGISFFLYFVNALDIGKRKLGTAAQKAGGRSVPFADSQHAMNDSTRSVFPGQTKGIKEMTEEYKDRIPQRNCPKCSHILTRDEPLYASHIGLGNEKKVLIYGCPYCYKG